MDEFRAKIKENLGEGLRKPAVTFHDAPVYEPGDDVGELLRFLKARDWNVAKAWDQYQAHLVCSMMRLDLPAQIWRAEFKPENITAADIPNEKDKGKFALLPPAKDGSATLAFFAAKHIPGEIPPEETMKYVVYMLEKAIARSAAPMSPTNP